MVELDELGSQEGALGRLLFRLEAYLSSHSLSSTLAPYLLAEQLPQGSGEPAENTPSGRHGVQGHSQECLSKSSLF